MNRVLIYIKRKPLSQYYSIEGLFDSIMFEVSKSYNIVTLHCKYSGGLPSVILANCVAFKKPKKSISHITGDVHYMALVTGRATVLTIHDIGSAINGSFIKRFYIKLFWFWLPALLVKRITVISEFTKGELKKIIPFAKNKIRVVYNPVSSFFQYSEFDFNEKLPTVLCVGTKSNKNLERIFKALEFIPCHVHIIGELTAIQLKLLKELDVNFTNSIGLSTKGIIKAYSDCDMLCFPSIYEGFGIPIIEAQAIGRPVITSNFGAMLEVAKDSACLVDPYSISDIKKGIQKIISNSNYRDDLVTKGLGNVKRFEIETIAQQYISVYKELGLE